MFYNTPYRIKDNIWALGNPLFPSFVIGFEDKTIILEPQLSGAWETVKQQMRDIGLSMDNLEVVILHEHYDHVMMLFPVLKEVGNCIVYAPRGTEELLKKEKVLQGYVRNDEYSSLKVYGSFYEGDRVVPCMKDINELSSYGFEAVGLPGHSPYSHGIVYQGVLFVSDALGYIGKELGLVPLFFYDLGKYLESIEKVKSLVREVETLVVGHCAVFYREEVEQVVEDAYRLAVSLAEEIADKGLREEEVFRRIYRGEFLYYPEQVIRVCAKYLVKRALADLH
ncbi:hypothetical protein TST_1179 [Thermosulfidibacter takaii ABI70S6]|uniref:Metallo-beta-lactamase domain-containing protein n=1 Tax=Thermosulfidibacter takaii (strain DSM 17441 / JCM 13301 / NBRC 103674 / ABI70S6) TaxID=1298851 RepID=A0A0S3QUH8_THET7|nr:MBL fold metallo-hydrolase [Thermosulfidibacter takaii]BAT71971.1 hypothetical protein TST_1179 [Thermosulfidibacter takaii ABI70S6]